MTYYLAAFTLYVQALRSGARFAGIRNNEGRLEVLGYILRRQYRPSWLRVAIEGAN